MGETLRIEGICSGQGWSYIHDLLGAQKCQREPPLPFPAQGNSTWKCLNLFSTAKALGWKRFERMGRCKS